MPLIQRVLIAVDDSKAALHAFLEALAMDRRFGCRLLAVGVAPLYEGDLELVGGRDLKATLDEPILSVLEEAIRIAEEEGVGLTTFKGRGDRSEVILNLAARESCDLIVLGQESRFLCNAWNSLTARLLRHSPVDILIIPNQKPLRFNRILCAEDAFPFFPLTPKSATAIGRGDDGLSPPEGDVNGGPLPEKACFSPQAADLHREPTFHVTVHQGPLTEIPKAAQAEGTDLIVLLGDESGGILKALTGGTIYRIVRAAPCPVWVVKSSDRGRIQ